MSDGGKGVVIDAPIKRSDEATAEQFGISGEQARKTLYVADNADLLDPADWDEGRVSTNKAFG